MAKSRSYQSNLSEALKDPNEAIEYLNAAMEDGEPEVFLLALRDVVDSYGGMSKLAASTSLNRENLLLITVGQGPIEPRFCKNRLDKSCRLGYCRVDESRQAIQR